MIKQSKDLYRYIIIIILQVLVIVYWANMKTNYHVDELYSMGYASNFTEMGDRAWYITTSPEFELNKWVKNTELKKYLIISDEESIFAASPVAVLKKTIKGRNYTALLNIAYSMSGLSRISAVPGLVLNIILFIIAELSLVSFMKKLNMDDTVVLLAVAMFGFSGYMISMAEYIRFYMLVIMFMLMMLNCFYRVWKADSWRSIICFEIIIMVLEYLSFKNSEFAIPFFGAYMLCFAIALIATKRWKQAVSFGSLFLCGLIYFVATQDMVNVLLNPTSYISKHGQYAIASMNIRDVSISTLRSYFIWLNRLLETLYVSSRFLVYALLVIVTILFIKYLRKDNDSMLGSRTKGVSNTTVILFVGWIIILLVSGVLNQGRLISVIVLVVIACIGCSEAMGIELDRIRIHLSTNTTFMCALIGEIIIFTAFDALCRYETWRYYCYGFVSIAVAVWFLIDRVLKLGALQIIKKPLLIVLSLFVVINAALPFWTRNIENMYEDEKGFIDSIKEHNGMDVVLVSEVEEDGLLSRHEVYDLVNILPEDTSIYVINKDDYRHDTADYPDSFILWTYIDRDVSQVISDLMIHGYSAREIGEDHCSKVFVCNRL